MQNKPRKKSKKLRNILFILVVIALVAAIAAFGMKNSGKKTQHKLASYQEAEKAERGDITKKVSAQGPLSPYDTVHVRSEASGRVFKIFVDTGDYVKRGDPIVELNQEVLLIDLRRAESAVDAARANLQQQKKGWVPAEKSRVEQQIRTIEIELSQRETELTRVKKLHDEGFASDADLEAAQYARDQAAVSLENAKEQLDILLEGNPKEIVAYYQASYDIAKAEYEKAQSALGNATIVSPMDGVILEKMVTEGSIIVSSQASFGAGNDLVVLIGDLSRMKIKALVDETDIGQVKVGQKATITVDAYEGEEFEASVVKINPMGNVSSTVTSFEVEMDIDNPDDMLLPNLTAYVDIITDEVKDILRVPDRGILRSSGKDYVFVVDDNDIISQREVEIGETDYEYTEIKSGLTEGERVLVKGVPTKLYEEEKKEEKEEEKEDGDT